MKPQKETGTLTAYCQVKEDNLNTLIPTTWEISEKVCSFYGDKGQWLSC